MNKILCLVSAVAISTLTACATKSSGASAKCPSDLTGYVAGQTEAYVKSCMGNPSYEDHNPDGGFVYLYNINKNFTFTFLFDKSGVVIRTAGYKKD